MEKNAVCRWPLLRTSSLAGFRHSLFWPFLNHGSWVDVKGIHQLDKITHDIFLGNIGNWTYCTNLIKYKVYYLIKLSNPSQPAIASWTFKYNLASYTPIYTRCQNPLKSITLCGAHIEQWRMRRMFGHTSHTKLGNQRDDGVQSPLTQA